MLISYVYPPAPGGGSPRLVRWTRALSQAGYEPIVITVKPTFTRGEDLSLLSEVSGLARIERTSSLDPKRIFYLFQKLARPPKPASKQKELTRETGATAPGFAFRLYSAARNWFLIPDEMIGWAPFAVLRALRIIRKERPALIITSSSPHSVQLIGLILKKIFRIPWLADFRDAWARHPYYLYPTGWHRRLNAKMEAAVIKNADAATWAYGLKDAEKAYPRLKNKFHSLHNGFHEKDFSDAVPLRQPGFNLLYLGAFYGAQTPKFFLAALKSLLQKRPEIGSELRVWMIGQFNPEHIELVKSFGLQDQVTLKEFLPHGEIASWMLSADVLLLFLGADLRDSMVIPGKVFEYIRAPGWILAMIPEGETAEVLRAAGGSLIVPGSQPEKIEAALLELYRLWKQGQKPSRDQAYVSSKEEDQLKREIIKIVSSLTATNRKT